LFNRKITRDSNEIFSYDPATGEKETVAEFAKRFYIQMSTLNLGERNPIKRICNLARRVVMKCVPAEHHHRLREEYYQKLREAHLERTSKSTVNGIPSQSI